MSAPPVSTVPLSKTRVSAGLQCPKRLYLECYDPDKRDPLDPGRLAILDAGRLVGRAARGRYPGGVAIDESARDFEHAVRQTAAALNDPDTRSIYEGAFQFGDLRVRVDILTRADGFAWDLIEVKSSTGYKEEYVPDLAIQLHVVERCGVPVARAMLLHVNNQYVWDGGEYDFEALFAEQDLSADARGALPRLLERIEGMREVLRGPHPPAVAIGPHCRKPYVCPFYDHCHDGAPEHHISHLPRLTPKMYRALLSAAIEDIRDIPDDFDGLGELHRRVRATLVQGKPFTHPDLKQALGAIRYPVHFLDFETCNPPLPIIPGTKPFEQTPFQWSDHVLEADGTLHHRSYLHADRTDSRPVLTERLLAALGEGGSIVVYSGFEARVIRALAEALPALAPRLLPLVETRMVDLLHLLHAYYYHPRFRGSFSIKDVLPVLVQGLDYNDLAIQEGSQAALAFTSMTDPDTSAPERAALREALEAYCSRDTMAMVRLFQTLNDLA